MTDASGGHEFAAIDRIRSRLAAAGPQRPPAELWIGDDAAVVGVGAADVVVAADVLVEGVHADLTLTSLADLGWKAVAVNVSDLAAMGCRASHAVVTVVAPDPGGLEALYDGVAEASAATGCAVVGGDLSSGPLWVVSVTVLGDASGSPAPVRRAGARPGDTVWVSGPLGAAAAGLRALRQRGAGPTQAGVPDETVAAHARPVPRVAEGEVARRLGATAMIDVSDGFTADLGHILDASGVGVVLESVPVAEGATRDEALGGGDDYELVWCLPAEVEAAAVEAAFRGLRPPRLVGRVVADRSERDLGGTRPATEGWEHWR